jgi:hypothetical protein
MSKRPRLRLPPCVPNDVLVGGIEWESPKLSRSTVARLKAQADKIAKVIADDWLADAKARLGEVGRKIAADNLDQQRRDAAEEERRATEERIAETQALIDRMIEKDLPALQAELEQKRKQRHKMGKAVKREREKLAAEAKRLARLKLARLRRR